MTTGIYLSVQVRLTYQTSSLPLSLSVSILRAPAQVHRILLLLHKGSGVKADMT